VKNLPSVETLGSTSAICSDKTGTLTLNKMTAVSLVFGGNRYQVSGVGYSDLGQIQHVGGQGDVALENALLPMALCSDATVRDEQLIGDPTEGALVVLAAKGGLDVEGTRNTYPRIAEVPFDSAHKFMATFHEMQDDSGRDVVRCFVKGAPDVVMARWSTLLAGTGETVPAEPLLGRGQELNEELAADGLRVIALARRDFDPASFDPGADPFELVSDLTGIGMVGIVDPPRPEARDAIAIAKDAGIRVRMITGDHKVTASAIGAQLGIEGEAISGVDLDQMDDEELEERIDDIGVIGRVAPEHKVRIVQALQAKGAITAMTGDGVNDAPALKAADIGIAMGITGTEVSKQAAEMILTDDNFATIVHAIELGRSIYDNMLKYLRYQLITLFAYIILFVGAAVFNIAGGAPLWPLQILWLNFAITPPLALALGGDRASPDLMERKPRRSDEGIMNRRRAIDWVLAGFVMALVALLVPMALKGDYYGLDLQVWGRTLILSTLSVANVFCALGSRSENRSLFGSRTVFDTRFMSRVLIAVLAAFLITEVGFLQRIFQTTSLSGSEWLVCIVAAFAVLLVMELQKLRRRRRAGEGAEA
jgi:Ca2+-transporting ATPase